ncbi:siderophore-interacting protein [Aeromicrobium sp.]|uniref:siderophore-interacting protein n=1 Tax=Aeromicrobium sp. TaxID=1871063 RepID=UPI0030C30DC3
MSKTQPARMTVIRTEIVAPSMRRVVFGGAGFDEFFGRHIALNGGAFTDEYVKLVFLVAGFDYPEPLDLAVVRETMPQAAWPVLRTYTVRWVDPEARELAIDFVVHGTGAAGGDGVAGPWAAHAQPGDTMHLRGPSGAYAPDPTADWHLFVGDEAGLPAICAALEALPPGAQAVAFIEVGGPADEIALTTVAELDIHWLHRGEAAAGTTTLLDDALRTWEWREGRAQAFIHGESALLKSVRPYVLQDRQVARPDVSVSAYWRRGTTEEGFRTWKSEQNDAVMRPGAS